MRAGSRGGVGGVRHDFEEPAGPAIQPGVHHDLATALETDRIIVLDKGHVVEERPPMELASSGGRFAALLELEAAGWDWRSGP